MRRISVIIKRAMNRIVLRVFNRVFSTEVNLRDIDWIRQLTDEGLHLGTEDVISVKMLVREGLRVNEGNADSIRDVIDGIRLCYSQEGESLILERFFGSQPEGFYVDVGAHHPKRFSNTYEFYRRGWRGVNIDPTPGVKELFDELRPEDVSLSVAVSDVEGMHDFYLFDEPALNTFSKGLAEQYQQDGWKLNEVRPIISKKLSTLLEELRLEAPIDFMSIDVEDHELQVLRSNDWSRFRPRVLLVEILDFDMGASQKGAVHDFVLAQGYEMFAKTYNTLLYKDAR